MATFKILDNRSFLPQGFMAAGIRCGLKRMEGKKDLGILYSSVPAIAAGMFTTNQVRAACIDWNKHLLNVSASFRAIVVNAGNANACTGKKGIQDVEETSRLAAEELKILPQEVFIASTGVIGVPLDMEKIKKGVHDAARSMGTEEKTAIHFSEAIITTDLVTKTATLELEINEKPIRLTGFAKGSGMIHPNMATMLAFVVTDAAVSSLVLQDILKKSVDASFNQITVDGDTSTNDMILVLANGMAGNTMITDPSSPGYVELKEGMEVLCIELAKKIARDGEGATKLIEVRVRGAISVEEGRKVAKAVASSSLVKSAVFGQDPNWGRIAAAAGRAGVKLDPERLAISLNGLKLMERGAPLPFDRKLASQQMQNETILIEIDLCQGIAEAKAWGCDLTYDYVKINAEYFT